MISGMPLRPEFGMMMAACLRALSLWRGSGREEGRESCMVRAVTRGNNPYGGTAWRRRDGLLMVYCDVAAEHEEEFNRWYTEN